jgi:hypothetical protein
MGIRLNLGISALHGKNAYCEGGQQQNCAVEPVQKMLFGGWFQRWHELAQPTNMQKFQQSPEQGILSR